MGQQGKAVWPRGAGLTPGLVLSLLPWAESPAEVGARTARGQRPSLLPLVRLPLAFTTLGFFSSPEDDFIFFGEKKQQ